MKIEFTRDIEASPEVVWSVITDFERYKEWNPFVIDCDAKLEPGAPISMRVRLGPREISQVETVSSVVEHKLFEYGMRPIKPFLHSCRQHHQLNKNSYYSKYDQDHLHRLTRVQMLLLKHRLVHTSNSIFRLLVRNNHFV